MDETSDDEILFEHRGRLGLITLNKPDSLNALTYGMVKKMDVQLDAWAADPSIGVVAIQGAGDKAFAAGGDIRWLYDNGQGGATGERNFQFFHDEYKLNTKIKRYPKPYVGIMDGIVMGGGVGVSIHGSHRFVTERTMFAMPETGIGLFPDVGATYFLSRMPGAFGMFCGLTGARLKDGDAARLLNATEIESYVVPEVIDWLASDADLDGLDFYAAQLEEAFGDAPGPVVAAEAEINNAFGADSVEEILDRLNSLTGNEWAAKQRQTILSKSPTSTRIAFRQIREGANLDFEDCMKLEYRLARYCMTHPDFYEGVRAVIIDKDNDPKWSPGSLEEASEDFVAEAFADLGEEELDLG